MVLMDIESYGRREENLATTERLMAADVARFMGTQGYSIDQSTAVLTFLHTLQAE